MTFFRRKGENPMKHFGCYLSLTLAVPIDGQFTCLFSTDMDNALFAYFHYPYASNLNITL